MIDALQRRDVVVGQGGNDKRIGGVRSDTLKGWFDATLAGPARAIG